MRQFLIVLFAFSAVTAFSQNTASEKDYYETFPSIVWSSKDIILTVALERDSYHDNVEDSYILSFYVLTKNKTFTVDNGACLYLKTFQDDVLTLRNSWTPTNDTWLFRGNDYTILELRYPIEVNDIQEIIDSGVKRFVMLTTGGYLIKDFKNDRLGRCIRKKYNRLLSKGNE